MTRRAPTLALPPLLLLLACHADTPVSVDVDVDLDHQALEVTTETRGAASDGDGYRLEIVGPHTRIEDQFESDETRLYALVFEGRYRVELHGVDPPCRADRPVREIEHDRAARHEVRFVVSCGGG